LPYLGQGALHQRINTKESWRDPVNLPAASTLVPQFLSPDLPRNEWFVRFPGLNLDLAATSYVGIAGVGLDAAEYKAGDPAVAKKMGIFGYDRTTPLSEIEDPANTILLIQAPPTPKSVWIAGGGSTVRGVPEKDSIRPFVCTEYQGKRGTYALMANGDVRFVHEDIPDALFQAMVTIAGGEEIAKKDLDKYAPIVKGETAPSVVKTAPPPAKPGEKDGGIKPPAPPAPGTPPPPPPGTNPPPPAPGAPPKS
jgi:hypothetical protein